MKEPNAPNTPSRGAGRGRQPPGNNPAGNGHLPCSNAAARAAALPRPTNPASAAAAAATATVGRICPWDNPCDVHRQPPSPTLPAMDPLEDDSDIDTDLFEAVMRLSLNSHSADVMRATGLIGSNEYTEYDEPDLSWLSDENWIVWYGSDGTRFICGVYDDWGLVRKQTNAVPGGSQKKFDEPLKLFRSWQSGWINGIFDDVTLSPGSILGRVVTRGELVRRMTAQGDALGITVDNDSRFAAEVDRIWSLPDHAPVSMQVVHRGPQRAAPDAPALAAAAASSSKGKQSTGPCKSTHAAGPSNTHREVVEPDDEPVYIVVRGREPGFFFSREAYVEALGRHKKRWGQTAPDASTAEQRYRALDAAGKVITYQI